jgi:hypothetical protein
MGELLLSFLTAKLLPVVVPVAIAAVKKNVLAKLPPRWIPGLLALGGAAVGAVGSTWGVETPDLSMATAAAWDGTLLGLATVGVHQLWGKLFPAKV